MVAGSGERRWRLLPLIITTVILLLNASQDLVHGLGGFATRRCLIVAAFVTRLTERRRHGSLQLIQFLQSIGPQQLEFGLPQSHQSSGSAKAVTGEAFAAQYRQNFVQQ